MSISEGYFWSLDTLRHFFVIKGTLKKLIFSVDILKAIFPTKFKLCTVHGK